MIVDMRCPACRKQLQDVVLASAGVIGTIRHLGIDPASQCDGVLKLLWTGGATAHFPFSFRVKGARQPYGFDICAKQYFDSSKAQKEWAARHDKVVIPAGESLAY
jgi:hypothetical protein